MNQRVQKISSLLAALLFSLSFLLSAASANPIPDSINLKISSSFKITRPTSEISTAYSSYFITGTSDPSLPVYLDGREIERIGTMGTFGILVDLEPGLNTFIFGQGDVKKTIKINRLSAGAGTIGVITQSSMFPSENSYVKQGGSIPVRCIAPAGAKVTASIEGTSVTLVQAVKDASPGVAAVFSAKMTAPDELFKNGQTVKAGKITYTLTYNGKTSTYKSSEDLYAVGNGAIPTIRVKNALGVVYSDADTNSNFRVQLKKGTVDYVVGQENERFKLSSGGYLPKSNADILTGDPDISNSITKVSATYKDRYESYIIQGSSRAAFYPVLDKDAFTLTVYNSQNAPVIDTSRSKLFTDATARELQEDRVRLTFPIKENAIVWGYNITYNKNGNMVLTFLYKPALTNGDRPFENLVIMLDPGHGGSDPGALGVAGSSGPSESDLNLAHAYVVKSKLESLGAKVYLTREKDEHVTLDQRLTMIERYRPDFFLSLHHNSIEESVDANKVFGTEVYYHTGLSKSFSSRMLSSLISRLSRKDRGAFQSYYRVTLLPYCPALLLELGFMSNPREYEEATTLDAMEKVADAVADAIRKSLS